MGLEVSSVLPGCEVGLLWSIVDLRCTVTAQASSLEVTCSRWLSLLFSMLYTTPPSA